MSGSRCTFQRTLLPGLWLAVLAALAGPGHAQHLVDISGSASAPAAPCAAPSPNADWFSASSGNGGLNIATPPTVVPASPESSAAPTAVLHLADNLRPATPLGDNEGVAAAAAAGLGLMLFGAWRWYRASRLPWPADPAFAMPAGMAAMAPNDLADEEASDATGWRLSRFDDLPDPAAAEDLRPIRPLYESLDEDDVIDVVPVTSRV